MPHGEFYLRGGHRLWKAPAVLRFSTCPEEGVTVIEGDGVILRSPVDVSGLEKERSRLGWTGDRVHLSHRITWHGEYAARTGTVDDHTTAPGQPGRSATEAALAATTSAPNRAALWIWPYPGLKEDERLELHDDFVLVHGKPKDVSSPIGGLNSHGWLARALGDAVFVKRFAVEGGTFPDMNSNVGSPVGDVHRAGTARRIEDGAKGESVTLDETWEVILGEFPANVETARITADSYGNIRCPSPEDIRTM
ncbi:MAG: hypothetical protein M0C28_19480 [Candidatus Moduliflexus flocculans]|nr:hypothetical protein [Candidatus Moduliflexus flocculans]